MRIRRVCWPVVLVLALSQPAFPSIRPSFGLDTSSWYATDIVVVITTGTSGTFQVVESWKGGLHVGELVLVPELRPASHAMPISSYPKSWSGAERGGVSEMVPRQPAGSRMILFLKGSADERAVKNAQDEIERGGWKPSDMMDNMKASAVWIDGDQLYCFTQLMNPGPSVLFKLSESVEEVRGRVEEINSIQESITATLAIGDGAERAGRLKPYVLSDVFPARELSLEELGKAGPSAVPTISGMLDDPAFADEWADLVVALAHAGGDAVGEELNNRLRQDLAFWRSRGPSLSQGWWNEDAETGPHAPLRHRYGQTYRLVIALQRTHYPAALDTAIQLRDFWRSLPQLNDPGGLDDMAKQCDKLISEMPPIR